MTPEVTVTQPAQQMRTHGLNCAGLHALASSIS